MSLKKISKEKHIIRILLRWYRYNARKLPWRKKRGLKKLPNSYYIFVSEFMLQQTTVNSVVSRFNEFISIWPTLKTLNKANEARILRFWSGLGYYARAKNLLKSIKIIANQHNYLIPKEYSTLIQLPGVGNYTAKAILGIAYNISVMPIDANIERILARLYCITKPVKDKKLIIEDYSKKLISKDKSSDLIQSFMDYGSSICVPKNPLCNDCLIQNYCLAFKKNLTHKIPVKKNKKTIKFTRAYLIVNEFNEFIVRRRPSTGMLQSMIEIPNDLWTDNKKKLVSDRFINLSSLKFTKLKKKIIYPFSHFNLNIEVYATKTKKNNFKRYKWVSINKLNKSGLPTVMKKIVNLYLN